MGHRVERVTLFDRETVAALEWPDTRQGDYARRALTPLLRDGPQHYIANVVTDLRVLKVDDVVLPFTLTCFDPQNSYVCSLYTHYISYGQEELMVLKRPALAAALRLLFWPVGRYLQHTRFDHTVMVNNWLLSTNLYPRLQAEQVAASVAELRAAFPDRAIVFRSVDGLSNPALYAAAQGLGLRMLFSRRIYVQDPRDQATWRRKDMKHDARLYRRTPYRWLTAEELPEDAPERLVQLYNQLYLQKYSYFNPQFTAAFVRRALSDRWLTVRALALEGRIDGVLGYVTGEGLITAPLFGYDTHLPQERGLYRLLFTQMCHEARALGALQHCSAGVGEFKRLRGGVAANEFNAVALAHLPAWRRRPWALLEGFLTRIVVPLIEKHDY